MSYRDLPPVAENIPMRDKASQTLLARQAVCPRSAYLYVKHGGGPSSHEMHRGSAMHAFHERMVLQLVDMGEPRMPWEVGKDLMAAVVADHPEWVITPREMDALRLAAFHICEYTVIDPSKVVAVEKLFELELGGMRVRGKVDLAVALPFGGLAIKDLKSQMYLPSQEDIDGSFQLPLYALLVAEGHPVSEEPCEKCQGYGVGIGDLLVATDPADGSQWPPGTEPPPCPYCGGTGRIEAPEPRIGERFTWFDLSEVYPRLEPWDEQGGKVLAHRDRQMSRHELVDQRLYIEGLVSKLRHGLDTGDWPAVPDPDGHCNTCPAQHECPIPAAVRGSGSPIGSLAQAEDVGLQIAFEEKALRSRKTELREYAKAHDVEVPCGPSEAWAFETVESEQWITGKKIGRPTTADAREQFQQALRRSLETGEEFRYEDYRKPSRSTSFKRVKLSNRKPPDAPEPSTEGQGPVSAGAASQVERFFGNAGSRDAEAERDARFGSEAPW